MPEITVAVPSHERPLRLRWLLNALEEQTLAPERFEVVVCHDSRAGETDALLAERPWVRTLRLPPGSGPPARQRNEAWRAARSPLVAFTDDDCRPHPRWLEELLGAAAAGGGPSVLQGRVEPDPEERRLLHAAPRARSMHLEPPTPWGETANIAYPRSVLERLGGFSERFSRPSGEDAELFLRAREAGVPVRAVPAALCWHAVDTPSLPASLARAWRWQDLPAVVGRHPAARRQLALGCLWRPAHGALVGALAGAALVRRPAALALLAPWAAMAMPARGSSLRGRLRAVSELPGELAVQAVEVAALARGSVRHRTLLL